MSNRFNYSSGKRTFGNFGKSQESSSYIDNLSSKTQTSKQLDCITFNSAKTQGQYIKLKNTKISRPDKFFSFNKANLYVNLVTRLNLEDACVIKTYDGTCPTDISLNTIPYLTYNIDPSGSLFGNSTCGLNNYTNYLECST
jgi:hypothetical protein